MIAFLLAFALIVGSLVLQERGKTDAGGFEIGGVVAIPYFLAVITLPVMEHSQWSDWAVYITVAGYYTLTFLLFWRVLLIPAPRSIFHTVSVFAVWSALILISDMPLGGARLLTAPVH